MLANQSREIFNPANILLQISVFNKQVSLSNEEQNELFLLQSLFSGLINVQKEWLNNGGGHLSAYWLHQQINPDTIPLFSQDDLLTESRIAHIRSLHYAEFVLEKILKDLQTPSEKYQHLLNNHSQFIANIQYSIQQIIQFNKINGRTEAETNSSLDQQREKKHREIKLSANEYKIISGEHEYHLFANFIETRLIPFRQHYDPLAGTFHINKTPTNQINPGCYGYTLSWADEIKKTGYYSKLLRHDSNTHRYQMGNKFSSILSSYKTQLDLRSELDQLIAALNDRLIYKLTLFSSTVAHATGIRKIPRTEEIEFFDSNMGLFVFPNAIAFKIWFSHFIINSYFPIMNHFQLKLTAIGKQPINTHASIPPIIINKRIITNVFTSKLTESQSIASDLYLHHLINRDESMDFFVQLLKKLNEKNVKVKNNLKNISAPSALKEDKQETEPSLITSRFLKEKVHAEIDQEITRLENHESNQDKIIALTDLQKRIHNAPTYIQLSNIVYHWLSDRSRNESNRDIIEQTNFGETTLPFIRKLINHAEVSGSSLLNLHISLLHTLGKLLNHDFTQLMPYGSEGINDANGNKIPEHFALFQKYLSEYAHEKRKAQQTLEMIIRATRSCPTGFFARQIKWRSQKVDSILQIIKKIDMLNPASLIKARKNLKLKEEMYFHTRTNKAKPRLMR